MYKISCTIYWLKTFGYRNAISDPNILKQNRQVSKYINKRKPKKQSLNSPKHSKIEKWMWIFEKEIKIKNFRHL